MIIPVYILDVNNNYFNSQKKKFDLQDFNIA